MADVAEVKLLEKESQGNQTETTAPTKLATEPTGNPKVTLTEPKKGLKKGLKMGLKMSLKMSHEVKGTKKTDLDSEPQDAGKEDQLPSKECSESDATEEKLDEAAGKVTDEVKDEDQEKGKVKQKVKSKEKVKDVRDTQNVKKVEDKSENRSTFAGAIGSLLGKKVARARDGAVGDLDKAIATNGEDLPGIGEMSKDPTNVEVCFDGRRVSSVVSDGLARVAGGHQTGQMSEKEAKVTLPEPKKSRKMSLKRSKKKPDLDSNPQDALATVTQIVGMTDEFAKQGLEDDSNTVQPEEAPDKVTDGDTEEDTDVVKDVVKSKAKSKVNRQTKSKGKVGKKKQQSKKVRTAVVSVSKAVGGIIGGQIGSAAAGAIVGAVYDVGTAIATRGDEMNGICGIIKDPTNVDSWIKAASGESESEQSTESEKEQLNSDQKEWTPKLRASLKSSKSKSMEVDSTPADQDLVRIYDFTSQTMRQILKEAGIALPEYQGGRSVSALVKQLQRLTEMAKNGSFTLPSYFKLYDSLHELVTVHRAEFQMTSPSTITLAVASESVCFDDNLKRFIAKLLLPVHAAHKVPLEEVANDKKFHCIYRFRCTVCARQGNEFVYVGQSKNFKPRFETHTGQMLRDWVKSEERSTLQIGNPLAKSTPRKSSSTVFDHPVEFHPDVLVKFSEILEVDIIHRFIEINKDKTIRRNWETFSQWLFKSIEYETADDNDDDDPEC